MTELELVRAIRNAAQDDLRRSRTGTMGDYERTRDAFALAERNLLLAEIAAAKPLRDAEQGVRSVKIPAKLAIQATYKVAIEYSVKHFFREEPAEGEKMFEVFISALPVKGDY